MPGNFSSGSFEELEKALAEASEWFMRLGGNVRQGRVGRYVANISELVKAYKTQEFDSVLKRNFDILTALFEAHDLISIFQALGHGEFDDVIARRIRKVSSGPVSYALEKLSSSSNLARNLAFELLIAERLSRGGLLPRLDGVSDIWLPREPRDVLFECKRLWTFDSAAVRRNFKDAERQSKAVTKKGKRLIVAFDLTRAFNPEFLLLRQTSDREIRQVLSQGLQQFIEEHAQIWADAKSTTIGVIARVSLMAERTDVKMYTYCQQYLLSPLAHISQQERGAVLAIGDAFETALARDASRLG